MACYFPRCREYSSSLTPKLPGIFDFISGLCTEVLSKSNTGEQKETTKKTQNPFNTISKNIISSSVMWNLVTQNNFVITLPPQAYLFDVVFFLILRFTKRFFNDAILELCLRQLCGSEMGERSPLGELLRIQSGEQIRHTSTDSSIFNHTLTHYIAEGSISRHRKSLFTLNDHNTRKMAWRLHGQRVLCFRYLKNGLAGHIEDLCEIKSLGAYWTLHGIKSNGEPVLWVLSDIGCFMDLYLKVII